MFMEHPLDMGIKPGSGTRWGGGGSGAGCSCPCSYPQPLQPPSTPAGALNPCSLFQPPTASLSPCNLSQPLQPLSAPAAVLSPCCCSFSLTATVRSRLKGESAEWVTVAEQASLSNTAFVLGLGCACLQGTSRMGFWGSHPSLREGEQGEGYWALTWDPTCSLQPFV